ncbi:MAG: cytochrome B6 [Nitrospirota bacterium]
MGQEVSKKEKIFSRGTSKTYGLMEMVKGTSRLTSKKPEDTAFVWPDLVYIELISLIVVICVLMILSLFFNAPLEEMASPDTTPNPMKAPWYFLGLQELLVFFDPWIAGMVLPSLIILGLIVIPYLDFNPSGAGYYSFSERKFAVTVFSFGLALWYVMIVVGTWLRGLDWQWYWPWDDWTAHKPAAGAELIDLEVIFQNLLGMGKDISNILSILIVIGYYVIGMALPFIFLRKFYEKMGFIRYNIMMFFFLTMMGVPLKIFLRLIFNIKYVLITPWFKI